LGSYGSSSSSSSSSNSGAGEPSFLAPVAGATFLALAVVGAAVVVLSAYRRARIRMAEKFYKGSRTNAEIMGDAPGLLP